MPSRIVPNRAPASAGTDRPYRRSAPAQITPTTSSMIGYWAEIASPQCRQRPLRSSHETRGMLSYQAMGCLQRGQAEGGVRRERSCGSRRMQTLRKLPRQSPRTPPPTSTIGSTTTRHLVEQDPRRHRHVERFRALRERDRHTPRGDGVQVRADARALVADDHRDRTRPPSPLPRPQRARQRHAVRRRRPEGHALLPRPRDEGVVVERHHRMTEGGPHRGAQRLGARRVGGAAQHDRARGTECVRRADQRADVAGVLYAVDDQGHRAGGESEIGRRPAARLDHGDDPLGRVGVGELRERAHADLFDGHSVPLQIRHERGAARGARELGRDQRATKREPRRERLFHEPDALDQRQPAPPARRAALEIADRRLQITGYGCPRTLAPAPVPRGGLSICQKAADGRYVKIALTIAGSDSGGGAGIQADLKTFHQFGVFGTSVITAVTAQNTVGVRAWEALPAALVALAEDLPPLAVKSGMLGTAELVETVAAGIARHRFPNYVLDPVMVATSGDRLLAREAEQLLARRLVPLAALVTPNLDEAAILAGADVRTVDDMERAGRALLRLGAQAALMKGGHLTGPVLVD